MDGAAPAADFWYAWARAQALSAEDRLHEALPSFEAALAAIGSLEPEPWAAMRAELLTMIAALAYDSGDRPRSRRALEQARIAIEALPRDHGDRRWLGALAEVTEAKNEISEHRYGPAIERLRHLLADHFGADGSAIGDRSLECTARGALMAALANTHQIDAALGECEVIERLLDTPSLRHQTLKRVAALGNWASALCATGRFDESLARFEQAIAGLRGLIAAGRPWRRWDLARLQMNMAAAYTRRRQHAAAIRVGLHAVRTLNHEVRRRRSRDEPAEPVAVTRAMARYNLAYAYHEADRPRRAMQWFQASLRDYELLLARCPHLRDDAARATVNLAHAELREGRIAHALQLYLQAAGTFRELIDAGARHLVAEEANARLGAARALACAGRPQAALAQAKRSLLRFARLTRGGQLQHAPAWSRGVREVEDALLRGWLIADRADGPDREFESAFDTLAQLRARPPRFTHPVGADPVHEIQAHLRQLACCLEDGATHPPRRAALVRYTAAAFASTLDRTAELLAAAEPAWLIAQQPAWRALVEESRTFAAAHPHADVLLVHWFLGTRGLRAQRDALAFAADERIAELRAELSELRRLEEQLLGRSPDEPGPSGKLRLLGSDGPGAAAQAELDALRASWLALRRRCDEGVDDAVRQGLLPRRLHLSPDDLMRQLAPAGALILLARPRPDCVLMLALRRPRGGGAVELSADEVALPPELARRSCAELIDSVPMSFAGALRGEPLRRAPTTRNVAAAETAGATAMPADEPAVDWLTRLADRVTQRAAARMAPASITRLDIVVSDDLHAVPWRHLLASLLPGAAAPAIYPSAGAWLQHRAHPPPLPAAWAIAEAARARGLPELRWVAVEAPLTRALVESHGGSVVEVRSVRQPPAGFGALVGMAHGGAVDGNPARAGLDLGDGGVLTGYELGRLRGCRVVFLSCCVLARTHDVGGEPLGFIAAAFGLSTAFAAGWLTDVPDSMACLFGLALQHEMQRCRTACAAAAAATTNSDVFESTRRSIADGRWPEGFGAWLEQHLPPLVGRLATGPQDELRRTFGRMALGGALYAAPPIGMPGLMPWVVCFGR